MTRTISFTVPLDKRSADAFAPIEHLAPQPLLVERYFRYRQFQEAYEFRPNIESKAMFVWGFPLPGEQGKLTMNREAANLGDDAVDAITAWVSAAEVIVHDNFAALDHWTSAAANSAGEGLLEADVNLAGDEMWRKFPIAGKVAKRLSVAYADDFLVDQQAAMGVTRRLNTCFGRGCDHEYFGPRKRGDQDYGPLGHQLRRIDKNGHPFLKLELEPKITSQRAREVQRAHQGYVEGFALGQHIRTEYLHALCGLPSPTRLADQGLANALIEEAN